MLLANASVKLILGSSTALWIARVLSLNSLPQDLTKDGHESVIRAIGFFVQLPITPHYQKFEAPQIIGNPMHFYYAHFLQNLFRSDRLLRKVLPLPK